MKHQDLPILAVRYHPEGSACAETVRCAVRHTAEDLISWRAVERPTEVIFRWIVWADGASGSRCEIFSVPQIVHCTRKDVDSAPVVADFPNFLIQDKICGGERVVEQVSEFSFNLPVLVHMEHRTRACEWARILYGRAYSLLKFGLWHCFSPDRWWRSKRKVPYFFLSEQFV